MCRYFLFFRLAFKSEVSRYTDFENSDIAVRSSADAVAFSSQKYQNGCDAWRIGGAFWKYD